MSGGCSRYLTCAALLINGKERKEKSKGTGLLTGNVTD